MALITSLNKAEAVSPEAAVTSLEVVDRVAAHRAVLAVNAATAALSSALLRRLGVLGDASWLIATVDDAVAVHLTWAGGRRADEVAAHLTHPCGGLPTGHAINPHHAGDMITLTARSTRDVTSPNVLLCNLPGDTPPPGRRPGTTAAWAAFDEVLTRSASPMSRTTS